MKFDPKNEQLMKLLELSARHDILCELANTEAKNASVTVEHVYTNDRMTMCTARVKLPKMDVDHASHVLDVLSMFTGNEDLFTHAGGFQFLLGDGDDSGAVWLENGCVCMWLRHWPKGQ